MSQARIRLRSRRDPAFWVPVASCFALVVLLALGTHLWMADWRAGLLERAAADPEAAREEAVRALRVAAWSLCAVMGLFSATLFRYFQLGHRQARLPPAGWWSLGAFQAIVGPKAQHMSRLGRVLSVVLLAATLGLVLAAERLIRLLGAGPPPS